MSERKIRAKLLELCNELDRRADNVHPLAAASLIAPLLLSVGLTTTSCDDAETSRPDDGSAGWTGGGGAYGVAGYAPLYGVGGDPSPGGWGGGGELYGVGGSGGSGGSNGGTGGQGGLGGQGGNGGEGLK